MGDPMLTETEKHLSTSVLEGRTGAQTQGFDVKPGSFCLCLILLRLSSVQIYVRICCGSEFYGNVRGRIQKMIFHFCKIDKDVVGCLSKGTKYSMGCPQPGRVYCTQFPKCVKVSVVVYYKPLLLGNSFKRLVHERRVTSANMLISIASVCTKQ